MSQRRGQRQGERGAVTAELALVLPLLVAMTVGLVWLLAVAAAQVRTIDAARETARAVARGDDEGAAIARGEEVAPPGSTVAVTRSGGQVRVTVTGEVRGPVGLFSHLPTPTVHAEAVAADEEPTAWPP